MGKQQDEILERLKRLEALFISESRPTYLAQLKTTEENQADYRERLVAFQKGLDEVRQRLDTADVDGKLALADTAASQKLSEVQGNISKEIEKLRQDQIDLEDQVSIKKGNICRTLIKQFKADPVAAVLGGLAVVLGGTVISLVIYIAVDFKVGIGDLKRAYEKIESSAHASQLLLLDKITSHETKESESRRSYETEISGKFQKLDSDMRDRFPRTNR